MTILFLSNIVITVALIWIVVSLFNSEPDNFSGDAQTVRIPEESQGEN